MSRPENIKIKCFDPAPQGVIAVYQDGSTVDPDATIQFDDAFRGGFGDADPGAGIQGPKHMYPPTLLNSIDSGMEMTLRLIGPGQWYSQSSSSFRLWPGMRVEFLADAPDQRAGVTLPADHLHEQAGQVRWFYGWVREISPSQLQAGVTATCIDGMEKANEVILTRSGDRDGKMLTVPKIAFNLDPNDSNFYWSYKIISGGGTTSTIQAPSIRQGNKLTTVRRMGIGDPEDPEDYQGTLKEIFETLQEVYGPELVRREITASNRCFLTSDLAALPPIRPGPIVLNKTGFISGVKRILNWVPDYKVRYDPRTLLFRIESTLSGFHAIEPAKLTGTAPTNIGGNISRWGQLDTTDIFSETPNTNGHRFRAVSVEDQNITMEFTVVSVLGPATIDATPEIPENLSGNPPASGPPNRFVQGSKLYSIAGETLPTVTFNVDNEVDEETLQLTHSDDGAFSSVSIISIHQETKVINMRFGADFGAQGLEPGWNRNFDDQFQPGDADREIDNGKDGSGIPVFKFDKGGTNGRVRIFVAFEDTANDGNHVDSEWDGLTMWFLTAENTNVRNREFVFTISEQLNVADIGDGREGMQVEIQATDLQSEFGGLEFRTTDDPGPGVADKVMLTNSWRFATTRNPNGRSAPGSYWTITTEEIRPSTAAHQFSCTTPKFYVNDGSSGSRREVGIATGGAFPGNNTNSLQQFAQPGWTVLAGAGLGATTIWQKTFRTDRPVRDPQCDTQWRPPRSIEAELEITTTDIRQARYPPEGEAGHAFISNNKELTLFYMAEYWRNDDQNTDYEQLAQRLWNAVQHPLFSSSMTLKGIRQNGWVIDRGFRVAFQSNRFVAGAGALLTSFWGLVSDVEIDFSTDTITINFSNASPVADLSITTFEDVSVPDRDRLEDALERMRAMNELPECVLNARRTATSPMQCGAGTSVNGRPLPPVVSVPIKDDETIGLSETGVAGSLASFSGGGSLGMLGDRTVIRDLGGNFFEIGRQQELIPGTVSGGRFTRDPSLPPHPEGVPEQNQGQIGGLARLMGLTPVITLRPLFSQILGTAIVAGPALEITIEHTSQQTDSLIGWGVHFLDWDQDTKGRDEATVTVHDSTDVITIDWSVTVPPRIVPPDGTPIRIVAPPAPKPDETDFPQGGSVVQDRLGQLAVINDVSAVPTITAGTLNTGTNRVEAATVATNVQLVPGAAEGVNTTARIEGQGAATRVVKDAVDTVPQHMFTGVPATSKFKDSDDIAVESDGAEGVRWRLTNEIPGRFVHIAPSSALRNKIEPIDEGDPALDLRGAIFIKDGGDAFQTRIRNIGVAEVDGVFPSPVLDGQFIYDPDGTEGIGQAHVTRTINTSGSHTILATDTKINVDVFAAGADVTLDLPVPDAITGKFMRIKRDDSGSSSDKLIIDAGSGKDIDGLQTRELNVDQSALDIDAFSTGWDIH